MKKILLVSLTLIFALCGTVFAAGVNGQYHGNNVVRVQYEGKTLTPDDVPSQMIDGRTMIPLSLLRKVGWTVEWDAQKFTANITTKKPEEPKTPLTLDQIKALSNSVALIYALDDNGKRWRQGSGFLINSRGLLITAYHVAEEEGKLRALEVEVNGKTYRVPAGVYVFADDKKDIFGTYLQDPDPLSYLKINDKLPKMIDPIYGIGNPNGRRNEVTEGYVSAAFKDTDRTLISGNMPVEGGYSGGPAVNEFGEVVGVITNGGNSNYTYITSILDVTDQIKDLFNK